MQSASRSGRQACDRSRNPISRVELRLLGSAYWWVVAVAAVFTLARFSEAFLLLKAQSVGLAIALIPGVFVLMNVVDALAAYPAGVLSDRINRGTVLIFGVIILVAGACFTTAALVGLFLIRNRLPKNGASD